MMRFAFSLAILVLASGEASAQSAAVRKSAKELVEFLQKRFAREVAEEGAEKLEMRFAQVIAKYGDDAAAAARKLGPRVVLDEVQKHGAAGARILSRHGDQGVRLLATDGPAAMRVFNHLGDEGVELMIRRHGQLTATQLPDLAQAIRASGKSSQILAVLEKYGDRACSFIWRNKGVIFSGAVLAAFLADPVAYFEGVKKIAEAPLSHIAAGTDWTAVFLMMTLLAAGLAAFRMLILRRPGSVAKTAHAD